MNRYTQYEKDGATIGVCHDGEFTEADKQAIEKFRKNATKRKPITKTIKKVNYNDYL